MRVERRSRRLAMLVVLAGGGLLSTATTIGITPFLLDIARDFGTDLAAAGNLVALQSVTWGAASLVAGAASDRLGRRPLLVVGLLALFISGVAVAWSSTYVWVAVWRMFGGLGGGAFMGTVFATVSDHFPAAERGRSLGWVVTGQSLALVIGVPAMTLIGSSFSWRGAMTAHSVALLIVTALVWWTVPGRGRRVSQRVLPF